ncbi:class I and II aminotransferase [Planoprotostelium fungivorum]|uniref:cysteine-S-conjugate beta-lyase n=1 Tax=Planoprotostelium fungivorum TaxID=1890364 RepID=A0A2P6MUR0_9EUKA|nr:class I and II aminotransferase [Planoprotostelium fungivorum]
MNDNKIDFDQVIDRNNSRSYKWDRHMYDSQVLKNVMPHDIPDHPDLLPMWTADMDFAAPQCVTDALKKRLEHPILGYPLQSESLYDAIISWQKSQYDWQIQKSQLSFCNGSIAAMCCAIQTFTRPGDKIIVQVPIYPPIPGLIVRNGRRVVENELVYREDIGRYEIDFVDLEGKLSKPMTKMIILVNPHNPVGRAWNRDELEKISRLCLRHHVILLCDDVWSDHVIVGEHHIPMGKICPENSISIFSATKSFNLAGISAAYVVIPNDRMNADYKEELLNEGVFFGNTFAEIALEAAYKGGREWMRQLKSYYLQNIVYVSQFCQTRLNGILKAINTEATYVLWIDCKKLNWTSKETEDFFLNEAKVWLSPGHVYGNGGEGFVRINVACPKSRVEDAMERIAACMMKRGLLTPPE